MADQLVSKKDNRRIKGRIKEIDIRMKQPSDHDDDSVIKQVHQI